MEPLSVKIPTPAGHTLAGRLFLPDNPNAHCILISSATGMLQRFYFAFARHFASLGYGVLTFDYWGIGDSGGQTRELKDNAYDLKHWGANDQGAATRYLKQQFPGGSLTLIGHSIAGQIMGFNPELRHIDRAVFIACQSGYWGLFEGWHRLKMWSFWNMMIPLLTPLKGYFPARDIRLFENLPRKMAYQWARWGRKPDYMMACRDPETYYFGDFTGNLLSLSFPGDALAPARTVDWLAGQYRGAQVTRIHYETEGHKPGHFGYFRPGTGGRLWELTHTWIQQSTWHG